MAHTGQVCFEADGFMFCNAIWRDGALVYTVSGKWFRFPTRRKTKFGKQKTLQAVASKAV
ncbi:hypothetical protein A3D70_00005 [Candidatus Adlerbacteria bacterium RIFCSPHIGHO2_02_FULL_54_18]|uniref:Uncharacterized protein n=1 Tax=Candidatus Adlerbacteria bacterium RIFCSPHIGHO2_02_FULL_54_18 TaxID=1797241 RepID=A0A1F4Y1L0_9BACT|nr:MAG: hypothetical protein A3D70_00005 [Candidatus Adlerbacteria bacterium RIFCSPHIGHO2_02_FULL_54_18]